MPGKFVVSLDFELFWGLLEVFRLEDYQENILGGRKAVPRLLELFQKYNIHATWAAVGFLFAENYEELKTYFPDIAPSYSRDDLSPYPWFDRIGQDEETAPCFFGSSLLRLVSKTPGQEIGSHTFCHYYCREAGQTVEQFDADMTAAKKIAADHGYDVTSVILPRNECEQEYTRTLSRLGFTAYRDEEDDWIHAIKCFPLLRIFRLLNVYLPLTGHGCHPAKKEDGIWKLVGSGMFKPVSRRLGFLEGLKMRRIKAQMRYAAKHGLVYHIWFHPHNLGLNTEANLAQLEEIFTWYQELNKTYGMENLNMGELAQRMEEENGNG